MRALVTGGLGFIGSHLVDALIERGLDVAILDNLEYQVHAGRLPAHANPKADLVIGDVCDERLLRDAASGVEVIFHHAARVGVGQSMYEPMRYVEANCLGTSAILDYLAKEKHSVKKLIVASSMSVYGEGRYACSVCGGGTTVKRSIAQLEAHHWEMRCEACGADATPLPTPESHQLRPDSIYAVTKRDQEEMCLTFGRLRGIPTVGLRYFNGFGPRQSLSNPYTGVCAIFVSRYKNGQPPLVFEDGLQLRDFVHVSDIVAANLLAMDSPGTNHGVFNVGSGQPMTILQIAESIRRVMGSDIAPVVTGKFRAGDVRHCFGDAGALGAHGFVPKMTFEEGIRGLLAWAESQEARDMVGHAWRELEDHKLVL